VSQGDHGIDVRGAPRRQITRASGNQAEVHGIVLFETGYGDPLVR